MSKSGFEDEVLIELIVGVVKHVTINVIVKLLMQYIYGFIWYIARLKPSNFTD
jgi:hypothetical protein